MEDEKEIIILNQENPHETLKKEIIEHPELLGLENVTAYKEEVAYTNGTRKIGQVDLVLWDSFGTPYLIELTTGQTDKVKIRVKKQARRAKRHFGHTVFSVIQRADYLEVNKF